MRRRVFVNDARESETPQDSNGPALGGDLPCAAFIRRAEPASEPVIRRWKGLIAPRVADIIMQAEVVMQSAGLRRLESAAEISLICAVLAPFFAAKWMRDRYRRARGLEDRAEASAVIVNGRSYPIVRRVGGAVESMTDLCNFVELSGWAADHAANAPAVEVIAAINSEIVARTEPETRRADIEQGFGHGIMPAGFTMLVPVDRHAGPRTIRVFALTRDGCAVQLAAALPAGESAVVESGDAC